MKVLFKLNATSMHQAKITLSKEEWKKLLPATGTADAWLERIKNFDDETVVEVQVQVPAGEWSNYTSTTKKGQLVSTTLGQLKLGIQAYGLNVNPGMISRATFEEQLPRKNEAGDFKEERSSVHRFAAVSPIGDSMFEFFGPEDAGLEELLAITSRLTTAEVGSVRRRDFSSWSTGD